MFQWCGRIIGHYPVCSWLRPHCSYLKRLANPSQRGWDSQIPKAVEKLCRDLEAQIAAGDPVHGKWSIESSLPEWNLWCDVSNLAVGVVLEQGGEVIEDRCWMRPKSEHRHINVAELDAVIKGLSMCVDYNLKSVTVKTDSKTVHGWLKSLLSNVCRVKVRGLYEALVRRRLEIVEDVVSSSGLHVNVEWVATDKNHTDCLTRVPTAWLREGKVEETATDVCAPVVGPMVIGPIAVEEVKRAQADNAALSRIAVEVEDGTAVTDPAFVKIRRQLLVRGGMLVRSVKVPPNDIIEVPVLPPALEDAVLKAAHANTGHGSWKIMYRFMQSRCYFPGMASKCVEYVRSCGPCRAADAKSGPVASPSRPVIANGPWSVVQIDTLELDPSRYGYHCVLVAYDVFSKWAEVMPLKRHDAESVAQAFVEICAR